MSLKYWFPMTDGTLKNIGLSNEQYTSTNYSQQTNGKLGKCIKTNTSPIYTGLTATDWMSETGVTFCGWFYFSESEIQPVIDASTSSYTTPTGALVGWNSYNGVSLAWSCAKPFANGDFAVWITIRSGSTNHYAGYNIGSQNLMNKWVHIAGVADRVNNKICLYVNGAQVNEGNISQLNVPMSSLYINGQCVYGGNGPGFNIPFMCNDIRVYDEPLTAEEIKKISRGLVLHYPLNRRGFGATNNINPTKVVNRNCTTFTYDASIETWTMVCPVNSSTWGVGLTINDLTLKWATGQAWVISMDVYTPQAIGWQRDINNKPDLSDISEYTGNDYDVQAQRYAYTNGVSGQTLSAGWNRIWFSQTAPTTYGLSNYNTNWGVVTTNLTDPITIKVRNIKGEIIDVGETIAPTPYVPHTSATLYSSLQLDGTIEYDVSGFGNNGTKTGTFTYTSDTPRYNVSTIFNGSSNAIQVPFNSMIGTNLNYTVSVWTYKTVIGTKSYQTILGGPSGFELEARNASETNPVFVAWNWGKPTASYNFNEWTLFTFVHSDTDSKLYVNGQLQATGNSVSTIPSGNYFIGSWRDSSSQNFEGNMSDFRIYATSLSAADVLELYNSRG